MAAKVLSIQPDVSIVTRGRTASAVASAAYIARCRLTNERDGITHDYSRSHPHERLVADLGIELPEDAPERLRDRSELWNEVERSEARSDSQLARKIMIPLPDDLTDEQAVELAREIVAERVADGHIIDAAIHCHAAFPGDDATEIELQRAEQLRLREEELGNEVHRNLHLHMLEPLREIDERGFEQKSVTAYLVRDPHGHEGRLTAQELKEELERGQEWEKVYRYNDGQKLTKAQAQEQGLDPIHDRIRKQPVQTTVYINNGWNDTDQLERWREQWQDRTNDYLERGGYEVRVDYRSYEEQGIEREPMVHEGYAVRALEREAQERAYERGEEYEPVTDVRRHNLEVEEANSIIERLERELERVNQAIQERMRQLEVELERVHEQVRAELERTYGRAVEYGREKIEQVREVAREVGMGVQERLYHVRSMLADNLDNPRTQERGQREAEPADMRAEPTARTAAMTNARLLQREPAREVYEREQSRILLERERDTGPEYEWSR